MHPSKCWQRRAVCIAPGAVAVGFEVQRAAVRGVEIQAEDTPAAIAGDAVADAIERAAAVANHDALGNDAVAVHRAEC